MIKNIKIKEALPRTKLCFGAGFTFIEIVFVMAILAVITVIALNVFPKSDNSRTLDRNAILTVSTLNQARSLSISSKNNSRHGVYFGDQELVIFAGDTYTPGANDNVTVPLNSRVTISNKSLSGGGSTVVFNRLSGTAMYFGSVTLSSLDDESLTKVINIYESGLSEAI